MIHLIGLCYQGTCLVETQLINLIEMELQEYPKMETSRLMNENEEVDGKNEQNGKSGVFVI